MSHIIDRCETCGVTADQLANPWGALIVSWVRWNDKLYVWAKCPGCERKEQRG